MKRKFSKNTEKNKEKIEKIDTVSFETFQKKIEKSRNKFFLGNYRFNDQRVRHISGPIKISNNVGEVIYWMSREQRVQDNWAFIYAQKLALKFNSRLSVCFCLVPKFLDATIRHYGFLLRGLNQVEEECRNLNINFHLLLGYAPECLHNFVKNNKVDAIITDFSPLRVSLEWLKGLSEVLPKEISIFQVDAHNVVPVWEASPKLEVGARTLRSKLNKRIDEFLTDFPPIIKHPNNNKLLPSVDWTKAKDSLDVDMTVAEVTYFEPGTQAGFKTLHEFIYSKKLFLFNTERNNPSKSCVSNLSPWLHFGQVAPQRCIFEVKKQRLVAKEGADIFIEEAFVRRELSDNFCFYNVNYDNIQGASNWSQLTLSAHSTDKRPYEYSLEQLTNAKTHDNLWNAAQLQMVREGKMHGFLRMYWAKKILEWTAEGPEEALKRAIWLNDRYSIDGRDPNGYTGIMWSICGVHDQGWKEREVFGKIRYMNYKGCERKFDVKKFVDRYIKH